MHQFEHAQLVALFLAKVKKNLSLNSTCQIVTLPYGVDALKGLDPMQECWLKLLPIQGVIGTFVLTEIE